MFSFTVVAIVFPEGEVDTAVSAFDALLALPQNEREGLDSTAVVQKDTYGQAKFIQSRYWTSRQGAQMGGILGLIIGLIFSGPLVGLIAGLGLGTLLGKAFGQGLTQSFLTNLQNNLKPGDTALIALFRNQPNGHELLRPYLPPNQQLHHIQLDLDLTSALNQSLAGYTTTPPRPQPKTSPTQPASLTTKSTPSSTERM
jgi:uncharacterized membrane protein